MGSPKQLLRLGGESLVRRAVMTALASHCSPVFVVIGAEADSVTREISDLPVERVENVHWAEGIGSSIRAGIIAAAATQPPPDAVLVTLADQPAVTATLLNQLVAAGETAPAGLVACEYAGTIGAPALFACRHFDALRRLSGDRGGKALLAAHRNTVVLVPFAPAVIDVDTPDDYRRLPERMEAITPPSPRRPARDRE
jgi:molybdenum cofactor cytidylyltransferase